MAGSFKGIECPFDSLIEDIYKIIIALMKYKQQNPYGLMKIFDLELNHLKHKKKLSLIKARSPSIELSKKQMYSKFQNDIKTVHYYPNTTKNSILRRDIINANNKLHDRLSKQYHRSPSITSMTSLNTSRTLLKTTQYQKNKKMNSIKIQNQRIMQKLLTTKSQLNTKSMKKEQNMKMQNKNRLRNFSVQNQSRIQKGLRQMQIKPRVYFPYIYRSSKK